MNISDLLPFYALDALTDDERIFVENYLAEHPEIVAEVEEMKAGVNGLPLNIEPIVPSTAVRAELMQRVSAHPRAQLAKPTTSNRTQVTTRAPAHKSFWERIGLQSPWPAATALGFAMAAIMLLYALNARGNLRSLRSELADLQTSVAQLGDANSDFQSSIAQLEDENAELASAAVETEALVAEAATLRDNVVALEAASATLAADNATLALTADEVEALRDDVVALEVASATLAADNATLSTVNDELQRQLEEDATLLAIYTSPILQTAAIASTDETSNSGGLLVVDPNSAMGVLNLHGLEALSAETTYQFWLIGEEEFVSAGIFEADEGGGGRHVFDVASLDPYQAIGVSIEPAGGSEQPTLENVVLLGSLDG